MDRFLRYRHLHGDLGASTSPSSGGSAQSARLVPQARRKAHHLRTRQYPYQRRRSQERLLSRKHAREERHPLVGDMPSLVADVLHRHSQGERRMMRIMTDAEIKTFDRRIRRLRRNGRTRDTLKAILMDTSIGGFGMWEPLADGKADAILKYLHSPWK